MRKFLTLLLVFLIIAGAAAGIFYREKIWNYVNREHFSPEKEQEDIARARTHLSEGRHQQAMEVAERYRQRFDQQDPVAKEWLEIFVQGAVGTRNPGKLLVLYESYPDAVEANEEASLLVSEILINTSRTDDYAKLRDKWQGKASKEERWFVLDADRLLIDGRRVSAVDYLNSRSFEGEADVGRLIRLALLTARENPRMAWEYLAEANTKDPNNTDVRSYRARLLEAVGKSSLALTEYLAAARLDPDNILLRDQLAEFYRRHGRYKLALKVWEDSLDKPASDYIWLKTWFWGRVATPVGFEWDDKVPAEGNLHPLLQYVTNLKPGQFWDEASFEKIPDNNRYLQAQQATYWLRLLQTLEDGNEKKASDMLKYNHFSPISWAPELEILLKRILTYRKDGTLVVENAFAETKSDPKHVEDVAKSLRKQHPFVIQIEELAEAQRTDPNTPIPQGLHDLLTGDNAFAAAFLAGGWLEAALSLPSDSILPDSYPEWVAYGLTQSHRYNQGNLQALEFATKQKPSSTLDLLIGELLISSGSPEAGLEKLGALTNRDDDVGFRASWLVSLLYIEQEQYDDAQKIIKSHPKLAKDVVGRETIARIALLKGELEQADKLYSALETDSWEAKSYLARKAFAEQNWPRARELTETLLREFPNNMLLRKNLNRIIEEQRKQETQP